MIGDTALYIAGVRLRAQINMAARPHTAQGAARAAGGPAGSMPSAHSSQHAPTLQEGRTWQLKQASPAQTCVHVLVCLCLVSQSYQLTAVQEAVNV